MKKTLLVLITLFCLNVSATLDPNVRVTGKIRSFNASIIEVMHEHGITKVPRNVYTGKLTVGKFITVEFNIDEFNKKIHETEINKE